MKRILLAICFVILAQFAQAQSPHPATNYLVIAVQDSNGWHVAAFDVDYQLKRGVVGGKFSEADFPTLKAYIESMLAKRRLPELIKLANKFLRKEEAWNPFPNWDTLGTITVLKVGMGGNIPEIVQNLTH